jgi:hypothetical protein
MIATPLRQTLAARGARANVKPVPNRVMALRFSVNADRILTPQSSHARL